MQGRILFVQPHQTAQSSSCLKYAHSLFLSMLEALGLAVLLVSWFRLPPPDGDISTVERIVMTF